MAVSIKKQIEGFSLILILMMIYGSGVALYDANVLQGYYAVMDSDYAENSQAHKTNRLKLDLAQAKLKTLEVGKIDTITAANELKQLQAAQSAKEETAGLKCKAWRVLCKKKELQGTGKLKAGIESVNLKLKAQHDYVAAIDNASNVINENQGNAWQETMRHFQSLSILLFGTEKEAVKTQMIVRLFKSVLAVILIHFGFIFYGIKSQRIVRFVENIATSPAPEQTIKTETENNQQKPQSWAERWKQGDVSLVGAFRQSPAYSVNQPVAQAKSTVSMVKQPPKVSDAEMTMGHGFSTVSDDNEEKPVEQLYSGSKKAFGFIPETQNGTSHGAVSTEKTENKSVLKPVLSDVGTHCEQCGTEFSKPRTGKKFCNAKCRREAWTQINGKPLNAINENNLD